MIKDRIIELENGCNYYILEDINYNISPNQSIPLILDRFIGVSCSEENFVFLDASEITYKYVDVIENGSWVDVQQTEARMIVNYASSDFPEEDARVETLHCTFIRDVETGVENGEFDINFTIRPFPTDVDNLIIVYGYHPAWDIFLPIYENDYMIENLKSVTKIRPGADAGTANSYIDINCPEGTTTSCTFSANDRYNPDDGAVLGANILFFSPRIDFSSFVEYLPLAHSNHIATKILTMLCINPFPTISLL